ncbi:COP9 signalosome-like protein subunit 6 [Xylariaceae sp. FL0255]|nr:COP9 signalosome-like protein subunit 6 [Xylariaceae sp. FL0255]
MATTEASPLLSSQSSDSGLHAVLHPLPLLTVSDYITRHTLRKQPGPVVGALIGLQNGREVTIEHAFECKTIADEGDVMIDPDWFDQRLTQFKTIHASPQLDLVGWYTLLPKTGPSPAILPIHIWILSEYNESPLLLGFHQEEAVKHSAGSRLPLTIYESVYEADEPKNDQGEDKEMADGEPPLRLKFRVLPYSVDMGEAERISMDFIAKGAGNATAVEPRDKKAASTTATDPDPKGKRKMEVMEEGEGLDSGSKGTEADEPVLSREEEEMIAALTAKANAIKMLKARVDLLSTYMERLPPTFLPGDSNAMVTENDDNNTPEYSTPSLPILRMINALVTNMSLVGLPSDAEELRAEMLKEANDVHLMALLNEVMTSVTEAREVGKKHAVIEAARHQSKRSLEDTAYARRYNPDL